MDQRDTFKLNHLFPLLAIGIKLKFLKILSQGMQEPKVSFTLTLIQDLILLLWLAINLQGMLDTLIPTSSLLEQEEVRAKMYIHQFLRPPTISV